MAGFPVARIVSGGQTGADRAALDVAIAHGIEHGGWCPAGGWAEDFPEPPGLLAAYSNLRATSEDDPDVRTRLNVRDSDATLVVRGAAPSPGTELTERTAAFTGSPCMVATGDVAPVVAWLRNLPSGLVLNVAGPRESEQPGIYTVTTDLLGAVLAELARPSPPEEAPPLRSPP